MSDSPASVLFDANGQPLATDPGTPADKALTVQTDPTAPLKVDGSGSVQPVSDGGGSLTVDGTVAVSGTVNTRALASGTDSVTTVPSGTQTVSGTVAVSNFPSGTATSALQTAGNASLASIDTKLTNPLPVSGSVTATISGTPNVAVTNIPHVIVDSAPTTAVTGVVTANLGTIGGAATETTLNDIKTELTTGSLTIDSPGIPATLGQKTMSSSLGVVIASDQSTVPVAGIVTANIGTSGSLALAAKQPDPVTDGAAFAGTEKGVLIAGVDGSSNVQVVKTGSDGAVAVQDNGSSLTVDSPQLPAALVSGRLDVNIGSGSITANIGTTNGLALDSHLSDGTQKAIARGGAKGANSAADITSTAEGVDHQAIDVQVYHGGTAINPTAIRALTSSDVVTSSQGTAAALSGAWPVKVTDGTNSMPTGDAVGRAVFHKLTDGSNTASVTASSALKTDSSATTQPISAVSLPLPTGAASETTLASINTKTPSLGQAVMASSSPVVIASNQSAVPISAASLPLPSGASSESTLSAVSGKLPATLGQKTMANSLAVTLASDQSAITVSSSPTTDVVASGTIFSIGGTVITAALDGAATATVRYTSGTMTLVGEASIDGINYTTLYPWDPGTGKISIVQTITINTAMVYDVAGFKYFQVRAVTYTSGTATVNIRVSTAPSPKSALVTITPASTLPVSGTINDGVNTVAVKGSGSPAISTDSALVVETRAPSAATLSNVVASASSVTLLSANTSRKGATIWNDSTSVLYVKFGTIASAINWNVKLVADAYYEVPAGYTGIIDGIWVSATGAARIAEITV